MTILGRLEFSIQREIVIRAPRATVFRFFTDPALFASWWGTGSTIDGRPGGTLKIVYPGGVTASGTVLELEPDQRVVFSYGYDSGTPIAPGASRVTVLLHDHAEGTRLEFLHEVADASVRDAHVPGWRYQLALFANAAANEAHSGVTALVDRWFTAWNEPDSGTRISHFLALLTPEAEFHDAFGCTRGPDDLEAHVAATRVHMPGLTIVRDGEPHHCQGTVLFRWKAQGPEGSAAGQGTNVFRLSPEGRIMGATGFWGELR